MEETIDLSFLINHQSQFVMIRSYLKIAFRNLLKNKVFSLINILGLAIGMTACLLILQYVRFELSYDRFTPDAEQLHRVVTVNYNNGEAVYSDAMSFNGVGPLLKEQFTEVEEFARAFRVFGGLTVQRDENIFAEPEALLADPSFLAFFDYHLKNGNPEGALSQPFSMVLTESVAKAYFGEEDPLGLSVRVPEGEFEGDYQVTGILPDTPANTHLKFNLLISYSTFWSVGAEINWNSFNDYTFVKVHEGTDLADLQEKVLPLSKEHLSENTTLAFVLQPVVDIHLHSNMAYEAEPNGSATSVYFLTIIAVFIIFIAWVNYINLSTARAVDRAKEVGIRKSAGAKKAHLVRQFLFESMIVNFIAALLTITVVQLLWSPFNSLTGIQLPAPWTTPFFWLVIFLLFVVGSLFSGVYPAFVLSSFQPIAVLKGKFRNTSGGIVLRKSLVVFQFAASVFLVAGTVIVYRQIDHMMRYDLGMNLEQVLVLDAPPIALQDSLNRTPFETFSNVVSEIPTVEEVSATVSIPAGGISNIGSISGGVWWDQQITEERLTYYYAPIDESFLDVYQINLLAGRNFSRDIASDTANTLLINDAARRLLGFSSPEEAVGEYLKISTNDDNPKRQVIGVVDNFNRLSLKREIEPTLYSLAEVGHGVYYSIRLSTKSLSESIARVEQAWNTVYPTTPFQYFFADEQFNNQYQSDFQFGQVFGVFALLAVFIACLGLYGLSAFITFQRTKEIGIRKVLGAKVSHIVVLLSSDFLKLLLISAVVSLPLVWWVMNRWLSTYAYHTAIPWWVFILSATLVVVIVLLTVSYQTIKAAIVNPATSLRYE